MGGNTVPCVEATVQRGFPITTKGRQGNPRDTTHSHLGASMGPELPPFSPNLLQTSCLHPYTQRVSQQGAMFSPGWSVEERTESSRGQREGVAHQTPSAFAMANCLVERGQTPQPPFPSRCLRAGLLKVARITGVGFILHPARGDLIGSPPNWTEAQTEERLGGDAASLAEARGRATGKAHCVGFSRFGTQGRDQASSPG